LLSIFIAIIIYLWQLRFQKKEELERDIKNLIKSINYFNDIFDKAVPFIITRPSSDELDSMSHEVITRYWEWRNGNQRNDHGLLLRELNQLQSRIHSELIHKLDRYSMRDTYNNNYVYILNVDNYESFMQEVYPYLNKVEGIYTSIFGIINENKLNWSEFYEREDYQRNLGEFYNKYWDVLLDIRVKSINIDKQMCIYKKSILNSLLDSSASVKWIYLSLTLIFIFGLLVPIYMIQPNKLGLLPCDYVFYIVVIFLITSSICPYISYLKRHSYETVIEET
jgi:hypothetical protein